MAGRVQRARRIAGEGERVSCSKPNRALLLDCARSLTAAGTRQFTRRELIECVQRSHPEALDKSLRPTIQGMTRNAPGGSAVGCGEVFRRVDRGLYELFASETPTVLGHERSADRSAATGLAETGTYDADPDPEPAHHDSESVDRAGKRMIDPSQSWDWEGNVQEVVAAHLVSKGWRIVAMADTATRG